MKRLFNNITNNVRDTNLRKNIVLTAGLKTLGVFVSFLLVPITIEYLNTEQYGIWMTLSSILLWFSFFDIGLGNGMRTYLTEAISSGDYEKGRTYITTTLLLTAFISALLGFVFIGLSFSLDLNSIFNTNAISNNEFRIILLTAIIGTLIIFVVKNIGLIYVALQKYAVYELLLILGNLIALCFIFLVSKTSSHSLLNIVAIFIISPILVYLFAALIVFRQHPKLSPKLRYFDISYGKQIIYKGIGFFFIQTTSCLVIFGGSNVFITQYAGPESVTIYNIAYKYFYILTILYTIIISPLWNAYTDAFVKNDFIWVQRKFNYALKLWGISFLVGGALLLFSKTFYGIWVGNSINIPFSISLCVLVYVSFFNLNNCVTYLINSTNKIFVQILTSVIITLLYVLSVLLLGKSLGVEGIIWCMAASYAAMSLIHFYQCRLIIKQKATGIWNK